MKKNLKRIISMAMCVLLIIGITGVSAFAVNAEDYTDLPYTCYTYLGDSVSWGYGLNENIDSGDPSCVNSRISGSFTDLIGKVLEENNNAVVHPAACSGTRISDFRTLFDIGMGVENPYTHESDWYGSRHPDRNEAFLAQAENVCQYVSESDLITLQIGLNDLTGTFVNTACATGLVDINKITNLSDTESVLEYVVAALENVADDPDILNNVMETFSNELTGFRENIREVVKDIVTLAPDDADIIFVGYYYALAGLRVIPDTEYSPVFDMVDMAIVSLNDYYSSVADEFDNVYYVEAPEATDFFAEGTTVVDVVKNIDGFLLGIHADAQGHEYIAECVLDALKEINTCHHDNTKTVYEFLKAKKGWGYAGVEVCTDCGKVVSMGKIITPFGKFDVPDNTARFVVARIENAFTTAYNRLSSLAK